MPGLHRGLTYSINSGLNASLFTLNGNVLRVADSAGLNATTNPAPQISIRVTDSSGAFYDKVLTIAVQGYNQVALTPANDAISGLSPNTQVTGAFTSLNPGDQITGAGDTALVLYGVGSVNLNYIATLQGVSEIDLIQYAQGTSSLTLKSGEDLLLRHSGTGNLNVTTADGHAVISSTTTGQVTLMGGSGQVDGSFTSQNLTVYQGSGAMTLTESATWPAYVSIQAGAGTLHYSSGVLALVWMNASAGMPGTSLNSVRRSSCERGRDTRTR